MSSFMVIVMRWVHSLCSIIKEDCNWSVSLELLTYIWRIWLNTWPKTSSISQLHTIRHYLWTRIKTLLHTICHGQQFSQIWISSPNILYYSETSTLCLSIDHQPRRMRFAKKFFMERFGITLYALFAFCTTFTVCQFSSLG